jgi:2-(1,2-epoxy-1,2-dihydrophenyl)acetyl-CoA isomerase
MSSMGSKVPAAKALEWGIVNRVVPEEKLDEEVKTITDYFANAPTKAVGMIKKMLNKSFHSSLEEMLEYEAYCQEIAGNSTDYKEGVSAFVDKRQAAFTVN